MRTNKGVVVTYNVVSEREGEFVVKMMSDDKRHTYAVAETSDRMHKLFREPFFVVSFVHVVDAS